MMIIAGTGHRPGKIPNGQDKFLCSLIKKTLIEEGTTQVITGMALGWDTLLAKTALELSIPLVCAVPFKGWDSWRESARKVARNIMDNAAEVHYVSKEGYQPYKYQIRNEWMVDRCDKLLAYWDGSVGGTYNCLFYAKKVKRPVINLYILAQDRIHKLSSQNLTKGNGCI